MRAALTVGLGSITALVLLGCGGSAADDATSGGGGSDAAAGVGGGQLLPSGGGTGSETCGNGLDDDGNGLADDGCSCAVGATQPCFEGAPEAAGKGACAFGTQTCATVDGSGEIQAAVWSTCEGAGAASEEACENGVDDDCDGAIDEGCGPAAGSGGGDPSSGSYGSGAGAPSGSSGVGGGEVVVEAGASSGSYGGGTDATTGAGGDPGNTTVTTGVGGFTTASSSSVASSSSSGGGGGGGCAYGKTVTLVLDRSNSMGKKPNGDAIADPANYAKAKWAIAVDAVQSMLTKGAAKNIQFGLEFFPRFYQPQPAQQKGCQRLKDRIKNGAYPSNDPNVCTVAANPIAPGATSTSAVKAAISTLGTYLCDQTPAQTALAKLQQVDTSYAVLVTDGLPTCKQNPVPAIKALAQQGKHTFVVGFDGSGAIANAKATLNAAACAGREPTNPAACDANGNYIGPGDTFYKATSSTGDELVPILTEILGHVCN